MCMELYHGDEDWVDWDPTEAEQEESYFLEESKTNNDPAWVGA